MFSLNTVASKLIARSRCGFALLAVLLFGLLNGLLAQGGSDDVLERYINLALSQNPVIGAADFARDAAAARARGTGALPDPMVGIGLDEYPLQGDAMSEDSRFARAGKLIMLRQQFPWPGALGSERDMAQGDYAMRAAMATGERLMLTYDVKRMYYEWAKIREQRKLVDSSRVWMGLMVELAEKSQASGMGNLSAVLRARTERVRMDKMVSELDAMEQAAVAELNICCQLAPDKLTTPPRPLEFARHAFDYDSLLNWAVASNADYLTADAKRTMAQAGVRNARKMRYPMFEVNGELMRRTEVAERMDMASGSIGMTLPLWSFGSKNRTVKARALEFDEANLRRDVAYNNLRLALSTAYAKQRSLDEQITLYTSRIVPDAQEIYAAALAGYKAGTVDLMTALTSLVTLSDSRQELLALVADYQTAWAQLESVSGRRLF